MATDTIKQLAKVNNVATGLTTYYTAPALTTTAIISFYLTNTTAAAITITVKIGGTTRVSAYSLPAGATYRADNSKPDMMAAADTFQASASATGVDLLVSGVETA